MDALGSPADVLKGAERELQPVVRALRQQLDSRLVAIALYGSRARGDYHPNSDWDLLVIVDQLPTATLQRHFLLKKMLPPEWAGKVSILAKTPEELEAYLSGVLLDIALDGIVLHDTEGYITARLAYLRQLMMTKGLYRKQVGRDLVWQWQNFPGREWSIEWESVNEK